MRYHMIKLQFIVRNILVTHLTHLPITSYHLQQNLPWNVTAYSPRRSRLCKWLFVKEDGAHMGCRCRRGGRDASGRGFSCRKLAVKILMAAKLRGDFITQGGERRSGACVGDNALPFGVAVQFRKNGRQILSQAFTFGARQRPDRGFNLCNSAHLVVKLPRVDHAVKCFFK